MKRPRNFPKEFTITITEHELFTVLACLLLVGNDVIRESKDKGEDILRIRAKIEGSAALSAPTNWRPDA